MAARKNSVLRKSDLTGAVATKLGGSKAQGEAALNAVIESIQDALRKGDRVVLTGFGSFSVRTVKARKVKPIRGGRAGALITVPSHKRVGFTAGADLNKAAQGKK
ncbi:MAG: HU family DNA-binding protein [SAR202 cluster bacterium]|nr:HU family DNA-binding protein [SAR202 cluster bacterium]